MEPPADSQARRRTGSPDQASVEGDGSDGRRPGPGPDGSTDDHPESLPLRTDGGNDWTEVRRRERRRERERRWEQLQLAT